MNNLECQKDELSALKSIYTEDEFQVFEEEERVGGNFMALIELSSPFIITYKELKDDAVADKEFEVEFLPPIALQFSLPDNYPSVAPPSFTLCCTWLNRKMLSQLCKKLDELWLDNKGMEILFLWTQFLKEESLIYLGLDGKLDVSQSHSHHLDYVAYCERQKRLEKQGHPDDFIDQQSIKRRTEAHKTPVNPSTDKKGSQMESNVSFKINSPPFRQEVSSKNNSLNVRSQYLAVLDRQRKMSSSKKLTFDPRAVMEFNIAVSIVSLLKDYNEKQNKVLFDKKIFSCQICFQQKLGQHCARFDTCGHVFCKECISEYFEVQIRDGNVRSLNCPEVKCTKQASPSMVKELVTPELFARYDSVLLTSTLDTLTDIVYCPRSFCQYPVTLDPGEKMAHCPGCEYVFCVFCRMVYHGVEPCRFRSGEKRQLVQQYQGADESEKLLLEQRYGKKQLQILVETYMSESWIMDNSQNCPNCNVAIEKSQGCNKMVCWKCNTIFCWICKARLNPNMPYLHFNNPNSACYNLLFQGVQEDDDDGWIQEYVEYL